ncbi:hypothetical protein CQW23_20911 [Capsicum baccatum]|uniref:Gag-pol polyprotein n=1 Tax=Capsicum baccatum TaxID=33114 RepID=A0A2G2WA18_CAPBA|nr:hypothetical protein CQW23_20911 [Capsicum baccatum]
MDETKSQEIESLKEENLRLRQQMMGIQFSSSYPKWHAAVPQHRPRPPRIYQGNSKSKFHPRPEFAKGRKEKDNFTPIGESYASFFQRMRQRGMITPLLGYSPDPHSRSFDPNVRCAYYSDVQGHSIEDCRTLQRETEKMIQDKSIMV